MPDPVRTALLSLFPLLLAGAARAGAPAQAPPPRAAPQGEAPAPAARPSEAEVQASLTAIGEADGRRLLTDRAYAAEILGHLDRIAPYMPDDRAAANATQAMRLLALMTLRRAADAGPLIDRIIEARPRESGPYAAPWLAALRLSDYPRAVAVVETASRAVPGVRWGELRSLIDREGVYHVLFALRTGARNAERVRFAEALFRIGWPGGDDLQSGDFIRSILLEDRVAAGDAAAARGYADGIRTLDSTMPLLLGRRFDLALRDGTDRLALLRSAIDREGQATRDALAAEPGDPHRLLSRAQHLRSLARDAEALELLRPQLADVRASAANGEYGMWVLNEAAYAMASLGRYDEVTALMNRVAALPLADYPDLISLRINHLELLWKAGRHEETLRRAEALEAEGARLASDYGKMEIASARVCALAGLDRGAEAAPQLERLRAFSEINPSALSRAYLCLGDDAAAGALMVHRLQAADPDAAIGALQDYSLGALQGPSAVLAARLTALRERPEVRAAFNRVGHRMTLPLSRSFYERY